VSKNPTLLLSFIAIMMAGCISAPIPVGLTPSRPPITRTPVASPALTSLPPTPTLDVDRILISTVQPRTFASYLSPDALWRVEIVIYDCTLVDPEMIRGNSLEQLFLVSTRDGTRDLIESESLHCGGLGAAGFEGRFWTADSKFFYYTGAREGVPDGCGYWERPLSRLAPNQRTVDYVGGGPISPDGEMIATWLGYDLAIWQLDGPQIAAVPLPVETAIPGPIAWSPDSTSIVYLLSDEYCQPGATYVVRMVLSDLDPSVLLASESPSFVRVTWDAPNRILLTDEEGNIWSYNLAFQELKPHQEQ
jgi:hypothetical protein